MYRTVKVTRLRQMPSRSKKHGGVPIMTTGVHLAVIRRSMFKLIQLLQRQCIHIRTQTNRALAAPGLKHTHNTRTGNAAVYLDAPFF